MSIYTQFSVWGRVVLRCDSCNEVIYEEDDGGEYEYDGDRILGIRDSEIEIAEYVYNRFVYTDDGDMWCIACSEEHRYSGRTSPSHGIFTPARVEFLS